MHSAACPLPSLRRTTRVAPARYMGREIATTMHFTGADWLVRDSRQREEDCKRLLKELHVIPGQVICDMGCGNGFYTLPLARLAGKRGKVYAVDVQQEMLDMLKHRAEAAKLENIVLRSGRGNGPSSAGKLDRPSADGRRLPRVFPAGGDVEGDPQGAEAAGPDRPR